MRSSSAGLTKRRSAAGAADKSHMKPAVPPTVSMDGPGDRSSSSRGDAQKGAYDKSKQIKLTLKSSTSAKPVSRCGISAINYWIGCWCDLIMVV